TVYRGTELEKIGMPIGGLCAGQVYLGGDGKLWHWDIFNQHSGTGAEHYAKPLAPASPLDQGFAIQVKAEGKSQVRSLDRADWEEITFNGEYPIAQVTYRDANFPVRVDLQAFSPFIPLNTEDSSLPATVMEFTVENQLQSSIELELGGWLENKVCLTSGQSRGCLRRNRLLRHSNSLMLECAAEAPPKRRGATRPDILFDDFERGTYGDWTATGTAFGSGPAEVTKVPEYQGELAGHGQRVVNSHASAPGNSVEARDAATGTLTSRLFQIERDFITFLIGGGAHVGSTCVNLLIEGKVVLSATGREENRMHPLSWDVRPWAGKTARIELVDQATGPWGNIGLDDIVFSDTPPEAKTPLTSEPDFGTMVLALLNSRTGDAGSPAISQKSRMFGEVGSSRRLARKPCGESLVGAITRRLRLKAGAKATVRFAVTWHMPNLQINRLPPGRHYGQRFGSAVQVAGYLAQHWAQLAGTTRLWHDTWYDSTLPYWFLDRTFLNTSILATSTCYRLGSGRFYAWEGVGCCEGTCGHVWQYAHAMARLFPELERLTREHVDFGLAQQADGAIHFRGEFNDFPAIDAQAGAILRALREHQHSPDADFLNRIWPRVKLATEWLLAKDGDGDGLIESNQHNTLDTDWFGPVAWLSGLYLAALGAAETMARAVGDHTFASRCRAVIEAGQKKFVEELFDGEYFINKPDPHHLDAINSGTGCEIDQVFGQSWAFQVGLPRVIPGPQTVSALKSLWRYNFTPDVGPYRSAYKPGRWYAMPGEAGLLMCTFPRTDWDYANAKGKGPEWAAGYFNECMNGFEYQVAGHMLWEGLVLEGLAVTRA
ncbi:MAG TPA: GH116 family glycosyl-hydrolase, partial [Verrucomicrobiae bacterium]|nr:GH116 family glycosyl-hydrolase [Verrucomicrobiae bacterium]